MRSISAFAAAAAALATTVAAGNQAIIHNYCPFNVYLWSVDASESVDGSPRNDPSEPTIVKPGEQWTETMRELVDGGVSIKLAPKNDLYMPITQLEYTKNYDTWYDVSNVNCKGTECPFQAHGLHLKSGSGCPTVSCKPGLMTCHGAYTLWDDNWASLCCPDGDPDIMLYLCTDTDQPMYGGSESSYSSAPTSTYSSSSTSVYAPTTTKAPKPKHTHYNTQVVEVTEVSTVVVTVTPSATPYGGYGSHNHQYGSRHAHMHAHAHAHRH